MFVAYLKHFHKESILFLKVSTASADTTFWLTTLLAQQQKWRI